MARAFNFAERLLANGRTHPERTALIEPMPGRGSSWRSCTFAELAHRVERFAGGFADVGVRGGDRVILMIEPSIEATAVYFALLRLGAIPVLVDPRMGTERMLSCVRAIEPDIVVGVPVFLAWLKLTGRMPSSVRMRITRGRRWFWTGPRLSSCERDLELNGPGAITNADDPCMIVFTSGSTGRPKAVAFTHAMMDRQSALIVEATDWRGGATVTMCFAGFVPLALVSGLTIVLPDMDFSRPARARPERIVQAIRDHDCDGAFAAPALWRAIARYCESRAIRLDSLRRPVTAGAPVPIALHALLGRVIHPDGRLQTPYGSTEAMPVTSTVGMRLEDTRESTRTGRGICVGRPVQGCELSVIRIADGPIAAWSPDLEVPTGRLGEIVVRGAVVTPGYERDPDANRCARIAREGGSVHRMGDLGRMDEAGRVWYCGRLAHRVETPTGTIGPVQLEAILDGHPSVLRTALVGVGPAGERLPVVCYELEADARLHECLPDELERLLDGTPWSGVVRAWLHHPGFPVDARHNSKIRRGALSAWAARRLPAGGDDRP